jgi:hypothetical protein
VQPHAKRIAPVPHVQEGGAEVGFSDTVGLALRCFATIRIEAAHGVFFSRCRTVAKQRMRKKPSLDGGRNIGCGRSQLLTTARTTDSVFRDESREYDFPTYSV